MAIDDQIFARMGELSPAEKKVARALLSEAPVRLLDEPTEGLDPAAADALLASLLATRGTHTLVVVTHRHEMLARFDEVLILDAGRIVQSGRWEELQPLQVAVSGTRSP